eukprot:5702678-Amphidinium_carterae.3
MKCICEQSGIFGEGSVYVRPPFENNHETHAIFAHHTPTVVQSCDCLHCCNKCKLLVRENAIDTQCCERSVPTIVEREEVESIQSVTQLEGGICIVNVLSSFDRGKPCKVLGVYKWAKVSGAERVAHEMMVSAVRRVVGGATACLTTAG